MRYYNFILNTNSAQVEAGSKIRLKDYAYDNSFAAMNVYMMQIINNDTTFFVYREEGNATQASFSFDEKKDNLSSVYNHLTGILADTFQIKKIISEPEEITMIQFMENLNESVRRNCSATRYRIIETANLWLWDYYKQDPKDPLTYDYKEYIIQDGPAVKQDIYDRKFIEELEKIEECTNTSEFEGNMVHYVLSARSRAASRDMTGRLMQSLYKAKRISSKRFDMICNMHPESYKRKNRLEDMIENNYGGVVVFDLTERFGHSPVEYINMSKYIIELVKRYRNKCLFVFTYDMDNPGFSYMILPEISKYVMTVNLREGTGNRKTAIQYMKYLIANSEFFEYVSQAAEYMKNIPGENFSQTEVLSAFDRFGPWCINKNIFKSYDFNMDSGFVLDRDENGESSYDKLHSLIGLDKVKKEIEGVIASDIVEKARRKIKGKDYKTGAMHMIFAGNPGSAKTTVAKLFAGIAKEKGILRSGAFVECGGMDLCGSMCVDVIRSAFIAAKGGVLFIDEAYALNQDIAITTLIQEMENRRDDVIVILAGYNERMKAFLEYNEGLKSRVPYWIDFPDYNEEELTDILKMMASERGFFVTEDAAFEAKHIFEKVRCLENFGNGRYVRNLLEKAIRNQSTRLISKEKNADKISKKKLFLITKEDIQEIEAGEGEVRKPGTALKELDEMVGLSSVKKIIHKAIAKYRYNKLCMERGLTSDKVSLHMVFTGNPGTAKTTVARLFAEIMKDEKALPSGNFVEVGRAELVGNVVGSTAKLVKKRFRQAQGGVLFIDEAYSLCDDRENSFGDEAINTIVQEMENHRDDVIVIFAGYPEPMNAFLERNPGMKSRIAFTVNFDDYSTDELCDITRLMISKKKMSITESAMNKLKSIFEKVRSNDDYGNGRFVRKALEEAELNLADRMMKLDADELTEELITTISDCDISDTLHSEKADKLTLGFAY